MNKRTLLLVAFVVMGGFLFSSTRRIIVSPIKEDALELQDQINSKKDKLKEIQDEAKKYKSEIQKQETKQATLENEIGLLENRAAALELDISAMQIEMEATLADIKLLDSSIGKKNDELQKQKAIVAVMIQQIHETDQTPYLEILLNNDTFSEFFDKMQRLQNVEKTTYAAVQDLKQIREDLNLRKNRADAKRVALDTQKGELVRMRERLSAEQIAKADVMQQAAMSEQKFQQLLYETKQDEMTAQNDVHKLEGSLKDVLDKNDDMPGAGTILSWPISSRTITAQFHDPTYPYRRLFEHSGIDVATPKGTPIKATAPAYVGSVKTGKQYGNYILLIHSGGIATLYAHLSKFNVKADTYVERGDIIGYTGGVPGDPGAGMSTGAHLHFEVRTDGIPTNPLNYLVDVTANN